MLQLIKGRGPGGLIMKSDILQAIIEGKFLKQTQNTNENISSIPELSVCKFYLTVV